MSFKMIRTGVTYKIDRIHKPGIQYGTAPQVPVGHPAQNKLEGCDGNTQEGDNVWMVQAFPYYGCLAEPLQTLSAVVNEESSSLSNTHFLPSVDLPWSRYARV